MSRNDYYELGVELYELEEAYRYIMPSDKAEQKAQSEIQSKIDVLIPLNSGHFE